MQKFTLIVCAVPILLIIIIITLLSTILYLDAATYARSQNFDKALSFKRSSENIMIISQEKLSEAVCQTYQQVYKDHTFAKTIHTQKKIRKMFNQVKNCTNLLKHYLETFESSEDLNKVINRRRSTRELTSMHTEMKIMMEIMQYIFQGRQSFSETVQSTLKECINFLKILEHVIPKYPHMAALGYQHLSNKTNYEIRCGGTLISSKFVITAAHCLIEEKPKFVRLGIAYIPLLITRRSSNFDHEVKSVFVHPHYMRVSRSHDIGLIELENHVSFSKIVNPACLYTEEYVPESLIITGWGESDLNTDKSEFLLEAKVQQYSTSNCSLIYSKYDLNVTKYQICATGVKRNSCMGDSGSPLQFKSNGMFMVVGITSVGVECGTSVPGLYTKVSSYVDWIESIVWSQQKA